MLIRADTLFGLEIPSAGPIFTVALVVHILAALTCVATGALAMLSRKGAGRHPQFGTIYYWGLGVVFASATILALIRWEEDRALFVIGTVAFATATVGYLARHYRWRCWRSFHIPGLGLSYIALLTAFYVDNGPHLPLWNRLPVAAFWVGPSLIGIPLILLALARHRPQARANRATGLRHRSATETASAPPTLED
jgi:uncharacterized membrane protein